MGSELEPIAQSAFARIFTRMEELSSMLKRIPETSKVDTKVAGILIKEITEWKKLTNNQPRDRLLANKLRKKFPGTLSTMQNPHYVNTTSKAVLYVVDLELRRMYSILSSLCFAYEESGNVEQFPEEDQ